MSLKLADFFLGELERESEITRRTLERVPEAQNGWKPHPKSMALGYLASLVATMPAWIASMVQMDELDMRSAEAEKFKPAE
jgi:DNA topoisomerase VI subunit B